MQIHSVGIDLGKTTRRHYSNGFEVYPRGLHRNNKDERTVTTGVFNLILTMVSNDRPTYKERHARNSSWPGELISTKGRIHLRSLVFLPKAFPLQSRGGPYMIITIGFRADARQVNE